MNTGMRYTFGKKKQCFGEYIFTETPGIPISDTTLINDTSLRVYHKFEQNNLLVDSSGNNRHAVSSTNVFFDSSGKFGKSAGFNGNGQMKLALDAIPTSGSFTIIFWGWTNISPTQRNPYFVLGSNTNDWGIQIADFLKENTNRHQSWMVTNNSFRSADKHYLPCQNSFDVKLYKSFVYDEPNANMKQYINGNLVGITDVPGSIRSISNNSYFLGYYPQPLYLNGGISDFAIFQKALTDSEINIPLTI